MHELLMPRLSGGSYDPPYDAIPILYYYFAIDSHKIKKTLSETSQKRADWWTSAQQTTKQEIKTIVEKISGFTAPAFTTSTGVSTDGNYLRFFAQNIHKSDNIKRFFDTDVSLIIEGAKVKNKRGSGAGDVNTSVNRETAAAKLEPLYETYKILKTHYEAVPISESNICTKLMEFKGRGNKDSNIFYTDSTLLQNFAKFCLWLNWYTTEPPRDKPPLRCSTF